MSALSIIPKRHEKVIRFLLYTTAIILAGYFLLPKAIMLFLPFILAFLLSSIIEPLVRFCETKWKLSRKIGSAVILLLAAAVLSLLLALLINKGISEVKQFISHYSEIQSNFMEYYDYFITSMRWLSPDVKEMLEGITTNITDGIWSLLQTFAQSAVNFTTNFISGIPSAVIGCIVFLLSSYFISSERTRIMHVLKTKLPKFLVHNARRMKHSLFFAVGAYIKAQAILMCITFVELRIWFAILQQPYGTLLALVISFFDALPFLGTGGILIPWAIFSLLTHHYLKAVILIAAYGVALAIRQFLEPKLVSMQIGMPPILTIMSIYLGLKIFGFVGVIIGPALLIIIKDMVDSGLLHNLYANDEEYEKQTLSPPEDS